VEEQALLEELKRLAHAGCEEVPPELIARIKTTIHWSIDDPDSVERAMYFMEEDPFLRREVNLIQAEFAPAEMDGLEDY